MAKKDIVDVGSVVYLLERHNRGKRDASGRVIPESLFRPITIVRGTPFSWFLDDSHEKKFPRGEEHGLVRSVPCGQYTPDAVYLTIEARDDSIWMMKHAHKVRYSLDRVRDVKLLKQVAALIGYDENAED